MLQFLLILLLVFVVVPMVRVMFRVWQLRRAYREASRRMNETFQAAGRRARQPEPPARKRKKIDPDVGEYVAFEEVRTSATAETSTTDGKSTTRVKVESQVEDAVWEDIK